MVESVRRVTFIYPEETRAVSLTGAYCAYGCPHCRGRYLKAMETVDRVDPANYRSFLVSGGFTEGGRVPLRENLPFLARLKEMGKTVNVHPGFLEEEDVGCLKGLVDCLSLDFVADEETARYLTAGRYGSRDYLRNYLLAKKHFPRVVPHLLVGALQGQVRGELEALKVLRRLGEERVVLLVLIPGRGQEKVPLEDVRGVLAAARDLFPCGQLILGCMRPGGGYRYQLDSLAIREGVDVVVRPHPVLRREVEEMGWAIEVKRECCALC
ncbi:hypothetical protein [Desulfovirgula thermocuniculi]|uniref:hypothetical protein n=1 Tax=Desulfovirgula thermocuniculi TaxID=348842 RepID=UPI0006890FCA|nr:hypothetical protein [Desulfovirgula thermocuniculi]